MSLQWTLSLNSNCGHRERIIRTEKSMLYSYRYTQYGRLSTHHRPIDMKGKARFIYSISMAVASWAGKSSYRLSIKTYVTFHSISSWHFHFQCLIGDSWFTPPSGWLCIIKVIEAHTELRVVQSNATQTNNWCSWVSLFLSHTAS